MSIHNNFPAISWIKLDGISVTKGEDVYIVKDFKTNLKYIYWSSDTHDQLTASNVMLSRTSSRFLIAINNKGECVLVPNEEIIVSFDGNSVDAITEHIWGLYEKDEEYGNRFVSVEQNIEGITHTVGQTQEELSKVSESVSKVDQKADSINLSVQNLNREYNNDKEMQELREHVNGSIIDANSALGIFKSQITDIFKDNKVSEDEFVEIQAQIDILEKRKLEVVNQVDRVILLMELEGNLSEATILTSQKQAFVNSIDNLISLVSTAISDSTIVPTEITIVTDAFGKASVEINTLKNTIDEIIFLGIGGVISEELAKISMKSDEIVLSVNKVEEKVDNDTAYIKNELTNQIKDVSNELNNLEDTMNNSFLDGVLSESEKIALKTNLENLATEKLDIDKQYTSIYNNADLKGTAKTQLNTAYNTFVQKYNLLVNAINAVVNKEGNVDINDQSNINSCIVAYRNALGDFSAKASNAINSIAENKSNSVDTKYAEILLSSDGIVNRVGWVESQASSNGYRISSAESEITQLADKITSKVSEGDVKSIIEQSPDEIRYGFNGISDYVTINTSGLTVNRGSIACDSIKASSTNPIIKLFEGNGLKCALDATEHRNSGIGDAIRLKRDDSNYIFVGRGNVAFYLTGSDNDESALCTFSGGTSNFKMNTKGGTFELNSGLWYNGTKMATITDSNDAYNLASTANSNADSALSKANSAYSLADSAYDRASSSGHYHTTVGTSGGAIAIAEYTKYTGMYTLRNHSGTGMDLGSDVHRWSTIYSHSSLNTSDKKYKENIKYLDDTVRLCSSEINTPFLDFIKNEFKPATYTYKERSQYGEIPKANHQIGFIANDIIDTEVGETFLYDFGTDGETDIMFSPTGYTTVVARALQEEVIKRDKEISELNNKNLILENKIEELNAKIGSLTDVINKLISN